MFKVSKKKIDFNIIYLCKLTALRVWDAYIENTPPHIEVKYVMKKKEKTEIIVRTVTSRFKIKSSNFQ